MITLEIQQDAESDWNKKLIESKIGTIFQTKEYGDYVKSILGWDTFFLRFLNPKGKIVAQLMLIRLSRFEKKGQLGKILQKIPINKRYLYRWVSGPVIFDMNYEKEIMTALRNFLLSKKCIVSGYEHPLSGGIFNSLGKPFRIKYWGTFLINLTLDKETLWNNLDKNSARKNIERSMRRGISVKEMKESDLPIYHKMLQETKRKAKSDVDLNAVESLWKNLHSLGLTGFLSYENEIPIGGILISSFNNYINEWGVARTEHDTISKLYSQDLLKWTIIQWGIKLKSNFYDLSGVNPDITSEKDQGIFRYKKKWGGRYIKYQICTLK